MREEEVPQDNIPIYHGVKKAIYASRESGEYTITPSSGWEIEEMATLQAVDEFLRQEREAYADFIEHRTSALAVWMYRRRMSLNTLRECSGMWKWQLKRHLKYDLFGKVNPKTVRLYCDILDVTEDELYHPKEPL